MEKARGVITEVRGGGARMRCFKCGHIWIRQIKPSKGQIIRCPSCRITLGIKGKPIKLMSVKEYIRSKAIDEYGNRPEHYEPRKGDC